MTDDEKLNQAIARGMGWKQSEGGWLAPGGSLRKASSPDYLGDANASCALEDRLHEQGFEIEVEASTDMDNRGVGVRLWRSDPHAVGAEWIFVSDVGSYSAARRKALAMCAAKIFEGMEVKT